MRVFLCVTIAISFRSVGAVAVPAMAGGTCTGFFVDQTHVVTCGHCVPPNATLEIIRGTTKEHAQVAFVDRDLDIAVLTCAIPNVKALQLGDSESLQLLDDLYVFGFPLASALGIELSASQGKLNARRSAFGKNWLQLDAVINPGNSGGPIVNKLGQLVGIAVAKLAPLAVTQSFRLLPERINFAIPSSTLRSRLVQAQVPFSISKPEDRANDDVFAAVRGATVFLLINANGSASAPLARPSMQLPRSIKNLAIKVTMTTGPQDEPTAIFATNTPKLYAIFKTKGVKNGDKLRAVWIADDVGEVAPAATKIDEKTLTMEGDTDDGAFTLSKPFKGWPAGKYHVEIYVNEHLVTKVKFAIKSGG